MRVPITLDLHLPNFNFPDTSDDQIFETLVAIATTAEDSGFSSVSLMDHLHQIPVVGPPENYMFDGNTMLAGIAARTSKLTVGLLVGGVTYRNPALHAKICTTLDHVSGGRAWFGIGAAWFEAEHDAYGFEFHTLGKRFEMLEECLQISRSMFTQPTTTFDGEWFKVNGAMNNPKPIRGDIPILIGGSGEKKTLRMVAQYADGCNLFGDPAGAKHLLDVLGAHCERLGRDPAEITKTRTGTVIIAATHDEAVAKAKAFKELNIMPPERIDGAMLGDPDEIAEFAAAFKAVGIEGLTISMPDAHDLEAVALIGQAIGPVFA